MTGRVQIYGQAWENMPAKIVGDEEGLRALGNAIRDVLEGEDAQHVRVIAFDKMTYSLRVEKADEASPLHYTCVGKVQAQR